MVAFEGDSTRLRQEEVIIVVHPTTMVIVRVVLHLEEAATIIRTTTKRMISKRRKTITRDSFASYAKRLWQKTFGRHIAAKSCAALIALGLTFHHLMPRIDQYVQIPCV